MKIEYTVRYTVIISDEVAEKAKEIAHTQGAVPCVKYIRDMYPQHDLATCNSIRKVLTLGTNRFDCHLTIV